MKRLIITISLIVGFNIPTHAQGVRHVQGISLIGGAYGIAPGAEGSTHIIGLDYSKYLWKNLILNISGLYESGNIQSTKVKNYLFAGGIDYTTFQVGNLFFFNAGLTAHAGLEALNSSENSEKKNSFVGGLSGNVNVEMYLSDKIVLQFKAKQNYLSGSMLGKWYPSFHAGLKYCIF